MNIQIHEEIFSVLQTLYKISVLSKDTNLEFDYEKDCINIKKMDKIRILDMLQEKNVVSIKRKIYGRGMFESLHNTLADFQGNTPIATLLEINQPNFDIMLKEYEKCLPKKQCKQLDKYLNLEANIIYISSTEGIYRLDENGKKLVYNISGNRRLILLSLKESNQTGEQLRQLVKKKTLQEISKEITEINKLFETNILYNEAPIIKNTPSQGYYLNKNDLKLKFIP